MKVCRYPIPAHQVECILSACNDSSSTIKIFSGVKYFPNTTAALFFSFKALKRRLSSVLLTNPSLSFYFLTSFPPDPTAIPKHSSPYIRHQPPRNLLIHLFHNTKKISKNQTSPRQSEIAIQSPASPASIEHSLSCTQSLPSPFAVNYPLLSLPPYYPTFHPSLSLPAQPSDVS